jgi:K+-sensing histidine kinase KdpD
VETVTVAAGQDGPGGPNRSGPQPGREGRALRSRWLSRDSLAIAAGLAGPLALTAVLVPARASFANTDAALALILVVVAVASVGSRLAGVAASFSAAAWFDFFLTKPYEQFSISRAADVETTVLLLAVGLAVTEIAVRRRRQSAAASRRAGYLDGIAVAAAAVAAGDSPSALIDRVSASLTQLLSLRSCLFQYGVAGLGQPARIHHDGTVTLAGRLVDVRTGGLPAGGTELLAESGGRLQGRFLLEAGPDARPDREQLLVAVALADQAAAALTASHPAGR